MLSLYIDSRMKAPGGRGDRERDGTLVSSVL